MRKTTTSDARRVAFLEHPNEKELYQSDDVIGSGSGFAARKQGGQADIRDVVASHTVVETLYEGRIAALERQCAFYVFFYGAATRASSALWPFFNFDMWHSQAGTRVATTPSPTSPSMTETVVSRGRNVKEERVTSQADFERRNMLQSQRSQFFQSERHFKSYDVLSTDDEMTDPGLDFSLRSWLTRSNTSKKPVTRSEPDPDLSRRSLFSMAGSSRKSVAKSGVGLDHSRRSWMSMPGAGKKGDEAR